MSTAPLSNAPAQLGWRDLCSPAGNVRLVIVTALMFAAYWPTIRYGLADKWLNDGNWSHGWLIPVFSLYFLHTRRDQLFACKVTPSYTGALLLVLSLVAYFGFSWIQPMAYPRSLSLIGAILGVTLLLGGWQITRVAWFPILFLALAVPLPQGLYVEITSPLRVFASTVAAGVMPFFAPGLHTQAQAVVIDYVMPGRPPGTLNVEEACSGMRLMMSFVTLGVAMSYLGDRALWQRIVMVICCLPIAVFCNAIRVTTTGLFVVYGREDLARGTPHQLLGIAMLMLALGLFALVGWVLSHLFIEVTEPQTSHAVEQEGEANSQTGYVTNHQEPPEVQS